MGLVGVYQAGVWGWPNILGEGYSFLPIPDCVYPATDGGIDGHSVQIKGCTRFVIEVPDAYVLATDPETGVDRVPDPERPDGFISLGPRVILDRAGRDPGFKLIQIYWRYWENRAIIDRIEGDCSDPAG